MPPLFRPPFLRQCEGDDCTNLSSPLDPPGEVAKPSRGPGIIAASYIPERPPLLWYLIGLVVTLGVVLHSLAVLIARYNWKELGARWWLEYFTLDHGGGRYVQGLLSSPRHKMRVLIQMRAMMKRRKAFS